MAIGDTINAALMRFDTSPLERAGLANAQANAAFGNALSMAAKGYFEGQEKKARAKEIEEDLIRNGEDPAAAKAISKNPFLQKEHQRRKATEAQMEIEKNRLAMQARSIAAQAKAASDTNMIRQGELGLKKEAQKRGFQNEDELKESETNLGRFLLKPTTEEVETPEFKGLLEKFEPDQIPGTPEFRAKELSEPMGARAPIMASYVTNQPGFKMFEDRTQPAPGVARLPERFQPEAQALSDALADGLIDERSALGRLRNIEKIAIAEATGLEDRLDFLTKVEDLERKRREEKRKEVEFEGEQKIKSFDGLDFEGAKLKGSIQDVTEAKKAKQGLNNFNAIMTDLERLKELGRLREEELILDRDFKQEAAVIANRVRGQIREDILGPGTVTDSERKLLEEQVPDPTAGFDMLSTTYGLKGVSLIEKLQNNLRKKVANNLANYGVTFAPSGQPATPVNQAQSNNDIKLDDGTAVQIKTYRLDR